MGIGPSTGSRQVDDSTLEFPEWTNTATSHYEREIILSIQPVILKPKEETQTEESLVWAVYTSMNSNPYSDIRADFNEHVKLCVSDIYLKTWQNPLPFPVTIYLHNFDQDTDSGYSDIRLEKSSECHEPIPIFGAKTTYENLKRYAGINTTQLEFSCTATNTPEHEAFPENHIMAYLAYTYQASYKDDDEPLHVYKDPGSNNVMYNVKSAYAANIRTIATKILTDIKYTTLKICKTTIKLDPRNNEEILKSIKNYPDAPRPIITIVISIVGVKVKSNGIIKIEKKTVKKL